MYFYDKVIEGRSQNDFFYFKTRNHLSERVENFYNIRVTKTKDFRVILHGFNLKKSRRILKHIKSLIPINREKLEN